MPGGGGGVGGTRGQGRRAGNACHGLVHCQALGVLWAQAGLMAECAVAQLSCSTGSHQTGSYTPGPHAAPFSMHLTCLRPSHTQLRTRRGARSWGARFGA